MHKCATHDHAYDSNGEHQMHDSKDVHPKAMPSERDYVDPLREVAARWGVSVDSLKRAARRGELQLTKLGPRRVGLRRSEGRRYLDSHTN